MSVRARRPGARAARLLGDRARRDVPLGPLTTYRVGGAAALFVEARVGRRPDRGGGHGGGDRRAHARRGQGLEPARGRRGLPRAGARARRGFRSRRGRRHHGAGRRRRRPARRGPADRPCRADRLRVGGRGAGVDRRRGAHERRRPRVGHGRDAGRRPHRRPADRRRRACGRGRARPRLPPVERHRIAGRGRGDARAGRRATAPRGSARCPRSWPGGGRTSPAARTPGRCSPTPRATRRAG